MILHSDVRYSDESPTNVADIYQPKMPGTYPVVILVHGGAFVTGQKERLRTMAEALSRNRFCVIVPNYRLVKLPGWFFTKIFCFVTVLIACISLCTVLPYPVHTMILSLLLWTILIVAILVYFVYTPNHTIHKQVSDISQCIQWTRDNAAAYGADPKSLFLIGHSAGGFLVTSVVTQKSFGCQELVRGVIGISGVYSQFRLADVFCGKCLLSTVFSDSTEIQRHYFPINNVTSSVPPHLLINANSDHTLKQHTLDYSVALHTKNVQVQTCVFKNRNHFNIVDMPSGGSSPVTERIVSFINHTLIT